MSGTISSLTAGTNPLVAQGTLNRLMGNIVVVGNASLNITAPFLGKEGIRLALEGESVQYYETMTGGVTSPQPFQTVNVVAQLLKTQALANSYKLQVESNALIGDFNVFPDTSTLSSYPIVNGSIVSVRELNLNGEDPGYVITMRGYYNINSTLWNLTTS